MSLNRITFTLPGSFPQSDYTPFGYLDNPYHTGVLNRSGVLRTVPPVGIGFWARAMPWTYGMGVEREVSYLSMLRLSFSMDGAALHTPADFASSGVRLESRYHTKTLLSYDWDWRGLRFSAQYTLLNEHALLCLLEVHNPTAAQISCTVHAINDYGYPGHRYWGCDGVRALYRAADDVGVAKVWAYGDIFVLGADRASRAHKATASENELTDWVRGDDLHSNDGALVHFSPALFNPGQPPEELQDHLSTMMSYTLTAAAGDTESVLFCLARGVNEVAALQTYQQAVQSAAGQVQQKLLADEAFYQNAPLLDGDWPPAWKHGWIYDLETIRMTIRPPVGIYQHHWDGMQIHTPRSVLGEAALDSLCLSYADMALAKEVMAGTFADAPMPNVPCSREDGSMNMISENGSECGTGPNWGFPFFVIQSLLLRQPDDDWLRQLYPYLETFLEWWMVNRTDAAGWFHADCSWESGQDGSSRFLVSSDTPGASTIDVRTVDIEASVAHAMQTMAAYAHRLGLPEREAYWQKLADDRLERVRSMYVDGWFRDFDARTGEPILLDNYFDVMMLSPVMLGLAAPAQIDGIKDKFQHFRDNPRHWLEWPSFIFPYTEAAWNSGLRLDGAEVVAATADRIYARTDARQHRQITGLHANRLPPQYCYRIPGVATEYWPLELDERGVPGGCEHYGWGATMPTLIIRNIIGFREDTTGDASFVLCPALPLALLAAGHRYGCGKLHFREGRAQVWYTVEAENTLAVRLRLLLEQPRRVQVFDDGGVLLAEAAAAAEPELVYSVRNGQACQVVVA